MKHTLLFERLEGFHGITASAICSFESKQRNGFTALSSAVTRWIDETTEGADAYSASCEDFNIGDLANEQSPDLLASYGVTNLRVSILDAAPEDFDRPLYVKGETK